MGAKYDYAAAFAHSEGSPNWVDVAMVGFDGMWRRFGRPKTLSVQDYIHNTVNDEPYSDEGLSSVVPPASSEMVAIYAAPAEGGQLGFHVAGAYILVCASVEAAPTDGPLRLQLFEEFTASLRQFEPVVLVAGEELEEREELVDRILHGESMPIPDFCAEVSVTFATTNRLRT